jgi:hypothetical protein
MPHQTRRPQVFVGRDMLAAYNQLGTAWDAITESLARHARKVNQLLLVGTSVCT